jgi:hypothetical protein
MADIKKMRIHLDQLTLICEAQTPSIKGLFSSSTKKRLRNYIEKEARKYEADIAVITHQVETENSVTTSIDYSFSLYDYR